MFYTCLLFCSGGGFSVLFVQGGVFVRGGEVSVQGWVVSVQGGFYPGVLGQGDNPPVR